MGISEIIALLSGVALFLFGMSLMGDGLKSVSGDKLEPILYRLSSTQLRGVLLGTGVTAVIQSSCATSVMVVGFVNSGMMKLRQAIPVILGSILGTSITGWVICLSYIEGAGSLRSVLSTATLTGVVAVVGIVLRMFSKKQTHKHVGDILMGFAVLMFGMSTMSGAVNGLGDQPWFTKTMTSMSNPILGILVGAAFTALLQSASAAVGILQALSVTGALSLGAALPLLFGITIGAAFPVLLSAVGATIPGKRTAWVYLVESFLGVIVLTAVFYIVNAVHPFSFLSKTMDPFSLAGVNTFFRFILTVMLLPFTDAVEAIVCRMFPDKGPAREDPGLRLEERFLAHPPLAIEQSRLTLNAMAELSRKALEISYSLLRGYTEEGFEEVKEIESEVDRYEDVLGTYLMKLTGREFNARQSGEVSKYLHVISDFERLSDHALNIAESAKELHDKKLAFSPAGQHELAVITGATSEVARLAVKAFVNEDLDEAEKVEPLEEVIDDLCDEMKVHHVERLQNGTCTILQGYVFNDLLTNFERVSDHCSNIAVAMLELSLGAFDTHEYLEQLRQKRTESFQHYSDFYRETFAI
ncbi:MAG: Na/Pi cotransporter family protein [Oscillospiraceae bacterium]|nr:Na/Pi cotransporter family protein [Oscillospiraceae bacterium]